MRDIISIPVALVGYFISVVVILLFCNWFFDKPQDWPYLIPIINSSFSLGIAYFIANDLFNSRGGAKATVLLIAIFWVVFVIVDITGNIREIVDIFSGNHPQKDHIDFIMFCIDVLLNSKIFAAVSALFAMCQNN